ncbi:hypothetical protein LEP1GSC050_2280 [Leptospira broomii serovar Hurstbridge str. 5399]|uniref:Uncharacterized protein n=1 Tax=Leptospira broomii serovar Hurstbridge str. 5399 TaxID=1049789 RepID=T0F1T9_9LEPT|nr:hypothetical protein [Leptospira broomii]EQA45060.1 hypothetical protein LEP1GSC050_2280 [Leptospira broomii serovar Hurstbridge str. 5399]
MGILRRLFLILLTFSIIVPISAQTLWDNLNSMVPEGSGFVYSFDPNKKTEAFDKTAFFLSDYLYRDLFYITDLDRRIEDNYKFKIISAVLHNLTEDNPQVLIYKNYVAGKSLNVAIRLVTNKEKPTERAILFMTNLMQGGKLAETSEQLDQSFGRIFVLTPTGKLVQLNDFEDKKKEEKLDRNQRADAYLFDEKLENDQNILPLLTEHLKEEKDPYRFFVGHVTMAQYFLSVNKFEDAKIWIEKAEQLRMRTKEGDVSWDAPLRLVTFNYNYLKLFEKDGNQLPEGDKNESAENPKPSQKSMKKSKKDNQ